MLVLHFAFLVVESRGQLPIGHFSSLVCRSERPVGFQTGSLCIRTANNADVGAEGIDDVELATDCLMQSGGDRSNGDGFGILPRFKE